MPIHDELGTRIKEFYESVPKTKLMHRTPVAIRIDDELNDIEKSMTTIQQFIEQEEK